MSIRELHDRKFAEFKAESNKEVVRLKTVNLEINIKSNRIQD
jgi:hypothetical protein